MGYARDKDGRSSLVESKAALIGGFCICVKMRVYAFKNRDRVCCAEFIVFCGL